MGQPTHSGLSRAFPGMLPEPTLGASVPAEQSEEGTQSRGIGTCKGERDKHVVCSKDYKSPGASGSWTG